VFGKKGALGALQSWKTSGRIRYAGASVHDRGLAVKLVQDGRVDVLMHRYNLAHRKAEQTVFPEAIRAGVPVIAFTATRWATLLRGHEAWSGAAPSAPDCYRFCATHPAVHSVLCAPLDTKELEEDVAVARNGRMGSRERRKLEAYGDLVHGAGNDTFETDWP
jgi:predicted aldo/keto reductase-like oxidoreductase